jgi:hypothetical protein
MAIALLFKARRNDHKSRFGSIPLVWHLTVNVAAVAALLLGRVDWAFYLAFGLSGLGNLASGRALSWRTALHLVSTLALCLAFAAHAVWVVGSLLLIQYLSLRRVRPELRQAIRQLPTRAEYVARSREACAAGGG